MTNEHENNPETGSPLDPSPLSPSKPPTLASDAYRFAPKGLEEYLQTAAKPHSDEAPAAPSAVTFPNHTPTQRDEEQTPEQPAPEQQTHDAEPPEQSFNGYALASFISVWFVSVLGIVFGHTALRQLKTSNQRGRELALAGTILGYLFTSLVVLMIAVLGVSGTSTPETSPPNDGGNDTVEPAESAPPQEPPSDPEEGGGEYQDPWIGTEFEEFCEVLFESEIAEEDTLEHLTRLADIINDPRLERQFTDVIRYLEDDPTMTKDADEISEIAEEAMYASFDLCFEQ